MKKEERPAALKERLRDAMDVRKIKAVELCEKTGIPKGAISYYLSGKSKPKADRLHQLAIALDVSEAWLLGYDVPMQRTEEQKKNDDLVQVIAQLRSDAEFFGLVQQLAELPAEQYASIKSIISALCKK